MTIQPDRTLILSAYRNADKRILFLDYDGTLVPFCDCPGDSEMGIEVRSILSNLSEDCRNTLYIISGRNKDFLSEQFAGIKAGLIAEHGFLVKKAGGKWTRPLDVSATWKPDVSMLFHEFSSRYAGTFLEEKESSVAFHYRTAGQEIGNKIRPAVRAKFALLKNQYPKLELMDGNNVLEIKPEDFNKGFVATSIITEGDFDFILAAGDDLTDESLFSGITPEAFTLKIGSSPTAARFRIPTQPEFIGFLKEFIP